MGEIMKLFRVTLRGMTFCASGTCYGISYVVAKDPTEAVSKVQAYLNNKDLGFREDRELDKVELLAEQGDYPACHTQLYL